MYSGVFRDFTKPEQVVSYYFECIKNREGFLTHSIVAADFFDQDRRREVFNMFNMNEVENFDHKLLSVDSLYAQVQTSLDYHNQTTLYARTLLKKSDNHWRIEDMQFPLE